VRSGYRLRQTADESDRVEKPRPPEEKRAMGMSMTRNKAMEEKKRSCQCV
jgi:hypothetical protein